MHCKINIIGRGNVATHLQRAFEAVEGVESVIINPHTLSGLNPNADFTIISVSDNAISEVASKLPPLESIIAHTSGSTSIDALCSRKESTGVFYPLQTFSKNKDLEYSEIPFFIEGSSAEVTEKLSDLARTISKNIYVADSKKRRALHVASVYACNFVNHLWYIAEKILNDNGMSFDVIRPLLKETLDKTENLSPYSGQTGPAVRKDTKTLDSHLDFLNESGENKDIIEIYNLLTSSIIHSHSKHNRKDERN
ncbi:MAG: DUF2520 domain-containing protein [Muribaculaceae bacterium]|nr:DUF2520 domain-containing protein [Muribaculaceae bacterium]